MTDYHSPDMPENGDHLVTTMRGWLNAERRYCTAKKNLAEARFRDTEAKMELRFAVACGWSAEAISERAMSCIEQKRAMEQEVATQEAQARTWMQAFHDALAETKRMAKAVLPGREVAVVGEDGAEVLDWRKEGEA